MYETREEQLRVAALYVADGLGKGERCLYAGRSAHHLNQFRECLSHLINDVRGAETRGALVLVTSDEAHLAGGTFDCERMLGMLNEMLAETLDAGFPILRTCGDMSWLLDDPPGATQIVEYEALLNHFFENAHGMGMCQYDKARLPLALIDHALATHATVVLDNEHTPNPFYRPAAVSIGRSARPLDVDWKLGELRRRRH